MKNAYKIAGFGLAAGAAVMIAFAAPATARGPAGGFGGDRSMGGAMGPNAGGVFALQFADLDTDGDGLITEAELTARADALAADRLAQVDTDGDGTVTAAELEAQVLARIGDRSEGRKAPGNDQSQSQRPSQRQMDPAAMATAMVERMLSARDADGDGVLSGEELSPAADIAALVDRFDTDDDNAWSEEEFAQVTFGDRDRDGHGSKGGRDGKRR